MGLLAAVYAALPSPSRSVVGVVVGLAAVGAVELGVRRLRPQRAGAWRCLELALVLLVVGDLIFAIMDLASPTPVPYPALPDAFYLATYLALTVALLWLGRPDSRYRDDTTIIDAASMTLAGSLIVWILLVRPLLVDAELTTAGRFVAVAGWVGYVALVAASVRVQRFWWRNTSIGLLAVAVFAFLVSEVIHGFELAQGTFAGGSSIGLGHIAFAALCGLAALHPSMKDVAAPAQARYTLGPWHLTAIAAGLLVGPTVLLVETGLGVLDTGVSIAIVSGLVGLLMVFRLAMTGRAYQRRAARERAVRDASRSMVTAMTRQDVVAGTRDALRTVALDDGEIDVVLLEPDAPDAHSRFSSQPAAHPTTVVPAGRGDAAERVVTLTGSDAALVFAGPVQQLVELDELVLALADQAALALQRIGLAEAVVAEERERYFRTLVVTSTDVILISRDGLIEYATPSAQTLFGRSVLGERFDDIVHPVRPAELWPAEAGEVSQWPNTVSDTEATLTGPDGELAVLVHRRDLSGEPTVRGVVSTMRDITAERALKRDLAYRASHDVLTGLANVRAWEENLAAEEDRRHGPGDGIAVIFVDVDNFKGINDRYGHPAGDELLAEVARRIQSCLRRGDLAARVGGDEFAALLRGLSSVEDARAVARRLVEALARPAVVDSLTVECQASVGLSYTEGNERVRSLVRHADSALYAAKDQGKGRWTEYKPAQWTTSRNPLRRGGPLGGR
jgi:diguanylate cyclase (GGDEF)-like protein